jgi:pimeloyl-ACP methyl ester carboxylesterase
LFSQFLPLATLFTASSVAALAQCISAKEKGSFDILVPVQTNGNHLPIFGVPGAGGNVLSLQPLSHALGNEQPFYGLQAIGLDGNTPPLTSVEETAIANIAALKTIQPEGPYRFVGHSYGGVVAYEMARILLENNETVSALTLIDSLAPSEWRQHVDRNERLEAELLMSELDVTRAQADTLYRVFTANEYCYEVYKPLGLCKKINVALFRAIDGNSAIQKMSSDYGWHSLLGNQISIFDIHADHFSILEKDHIHNIVKKGCLLW